MATLSELLNKVATYGGKIVSTSELSEMEIATANACNNMFVDENALGYVWVGKDVSSVPKANDIIPHVSGSCKGDNLTLTGECKKYGGECSKGNCDYYR